jgi:hypothetical protein
MARLRLASRAQRALLLLAALSSCHAATYCESQLAARGGAVMSRSWCAGSGDVSLFNGVGTLVPFYGAPPNAQYKSK